ncbi:phosphodiester glycosidase family protein [Bacillus wiedmannii]|uniref:phosphodiester glycosidase family protein n=1 Tax=Bacillus wiedmannii TaxID=1890302 RepID=UPI000BF02747|nr:phosphodiester glycosidase family protein [Bacillus wiedmannii]MDP1460109.1 phosphodiester glycosidase family protein [Bacillus wiedmannii]PEJ75299.1 branched-chain amino acid ABC transporter permease [Bacillus wiedmannii]
MKRSNTRKYSRKKSIRRALFLFLIALILGGSILLGTSSGHKLRVTVAEIILTSQHRYLAPFTLLSKKELADILYKVNNPKWKDSSTIEDEQLSSKQIQQQKSKDLAITIEMIHSTDTAAYRFEGKLITINNPFNVKLVTQQGTQGKQLGEKLSVMAKRNHALVAVNASGFSDATGKGGGAVGTGIIITNRHIIHRADEQDSPTLVAGLTSYGRLITGKYTTKQLLSKNVVYAAGFMPQLIVNREKMITNGDGAWGSGPRTIMAQKKDGSIMFLVIDGRQLHSIGATLRECQDILYEKGAVNALAMDGGASTALYAMGDIINTPVTSHEGRCIPNAWVVTTNPGQNVKVTIDGKEEKRASIEQLIQ